VVARFREASLLPREKKDYMHVHCSIVYCVSHYSITFVDIHHVVTLFVVVHHVVV
jgi:hypothetical protein